MAVITEADRVVDKTREQVDELMKLWARMVADDVDGADQLRAQFVRLVFEKLLALKDALH